MFDNSYSVSGLTLPQLKAYADSSEALWQGNMGQAGKKQHNTFKTKLNGHSCQINKGSVPV